MPNTDFPYLPEELSAFVETVGIFVISLKNGTIVSHDPKDLDGFYNWLKQNGIRDVNPAVQN